MTLVVAPIVEGQMEQGCLERLLQRIWQQLLLSSERLQVVRPIRGQRDALIHPNGLALTTKVEEAAIEIRRLTRKNAQARSLILILLDAEHDCPKELGLRLLQTAQTARADMDIGCALARRMFENWIVAGATTLGGIQGLPADLHPPSDPENRSGWKWLDEQIRSQNQKRKYDKTADSQKLVAKMDLERCLAMSRSFRKLYKELKIRMAGASADVENQQTDNNQTPAPLGEP
jgi:hypothetical protein